MTLRRARLLWIGAAILALVGAGFWALPADPDVAADAEAWSPPGTEPEAPPAGATPDSVVEAIVAGNLFSPEREPPPTPFRLASGEEDGEDPEPEAPSVPPIELYGIVAEGEDAWVLLEADPSVAGAEVYRVGDRVRAYRVVSIAADSVVLEGPSGRRVLRMDER